MSDDLLRDMLAKLQPGMNQEKVFAAILDDTLAAEGANAAEAFLACAVPHWFNAPLLAALLNKPEAEATALLMRVTHYSFVSQRPDGAYLYHENARAFLLTRVKQDPPRFRELSRRAATFLQNQLQRAAEQKQNEQVGELYFELLYHWLAVDDAQAFDRWIHVYEQLEFRYNLAACGRLLALAEEQHDLLTGDRPQWLRYYQGRLLEGSQRWPDALATWAPLLSEELAPKLKSWLASHRGMVYDSLGRWADALAQYQASLDIDRELGDRPGEARTLNNIGAVYQSQGKWADAMAQYQASLDIKRELGDRHGEGRTLNNIGNVYQSQGKWADALARYEQDLAICRELGDRQGEASTLESISELHVKRGEWEQAHPLIDQALQSARALGDKELEAYALHDLGDWHKGQGQWDEAIAYYNQALVLRRELGARAEISETLDALGEVYRMRGMWDEAVKTHEEALQVWRELAKTQHE